MTAFSKTSLKLVKFMPFSQGFIYLRSGGLFYIIMPRSRLETIALSVTILIRRPCVAKMLSGCMTSVITPSYQPLQPC